MKEIKPVLEIEQLENDDVQLTVNQEGFAVMMGYEGLQELLDTHETFENALDHWEERWTDTDIEVHRK